jgi:MoaA/NifB/PqqE/SkfB family radical SAM enzyme
MLRHRRYQFLYLWKFLQNLTIAKAYNYWLNRHEFGNLQEDLRSFPPQVIIDITNSCNLKCPLCPTGMGITDRPKGIMPLNDYERILDQLKHKVQAVHLYNWGEPLLVKDFDRYCELAVRKGFVVSVSSNLTMNLSDDRIMAITKSGLARIIISYDGATPDSYLKYRIKGNFERLNENIKRIVALKKKLRSAYPLLTLQFVRHRDNHDDIRYLREIAGELGVDSWHMVDVLLPFGEGRNTEMIDKWITPDRLSDKAMPFDIRKSELGSPCTHLWQYPVINHDLTLSPCCFVYSRGDDMADLHYQTFLEAWNSLRYRDARRLFGHKSQVEQLPCHRCSIYHAFEKNE